MTCIENTLIQQRCSQSCHLNALHLLIRIIVLFQLLASSCLSAKIIIVPNQEVVPTGCCNLYMFFTILLHCIQFQICGMCMRVRSFQRCRTGGSSVLGASAVYGFCLPASHAFISGVWRPQAVQPYSNHSFVSNACIVHSSEAAKHTVREVDICHKWSQMAHVLV